MAVFHVLLFNRRAIPKNLRIRTTCDNGDDVIYMCIYIYVLCVLYFFLGISMYTNVYIHLNVN